MTTTEVDLLLFLCWSIFTLMANSIPSQKLDFVSSLMRKQPPSSVMQWVQSLLAASSWFGSGHGQNCQYLVG